MQILHFFSVILAIVLAVGCARIPTSRSADPAPNTAPDNKPSAVFFPLPLDDAWTKWILGTWKGEGAGQAGGGHGTAQFELALGGQFLICHGASVITELNSDYLKKHLHATDSEIERFRGEGYHVLELYTIDQQTGEVIGFLFDNLRCVATGRGTRDDRKEVIYWEWHNSQKSTRITERLGLDKMRVTERTPLPGGNVMEDKGEMTRVRP